MPEESPTVPRIINNRPATHSCSRGSSRLNVAGDTLLRLTCPWGGGGANAGRAAPTIGEVALERDRNKRLEQHAGVGENFDASPVHRARSTVDSLDAARAVGAFVGAGLFCRGSGPRANSENLGFKTERWREKGLPRWPSPAVAEYRKAAGQFSASVEIVPWTRAVENEQTGFMDAMWMRSLRNDSVQICQIGASNALPVQVRETFDENASGWSGKPNMAKWRPLSMDTRGRFLHGPHTKEWIERPISIGKLAIDHMGGQRYIIHPEKSLSPRRVADDVRPPTSPRTANSRPKRRQQCAQPQNA